MLAKTKDRKNLSLFSFAEIVIILVCWLIMSIIPQYGWVLLIFASTPLVIRIFWGAIPFRATPFDPFLLTFLCTSSIALWAAYNTEIASQRFLLIIAAFLLFYSLANQTQKNLWYISLALGIFGIITTAIFLLVQDWSKSPADISIINQAGAYWTNLRPVTNIETVLDVEMLHANIVGGINAILLPLCAAATIHFGQTRKKILTSLSLSIIILLGFGLIITSSRAAWAAALLGFGLMIALSIPGLGGTLTRNKSILVAIPLILILLGVCTPLLMADSLRGDANPFTGITSFSSRMTIAKNAFFLIADYPFTGGGLGSFPGLYAQYILIIPFFMFGYSHNLYLDLAVEQGIIGFLLWILIAFLCGLSLTRNIKNYNQTSPYRLLTIAAYSSLVILLLHGIIDDPIYSNLWALPLIFLLPGLSTALSPSRSLNKIETKTLSKIGLIGIAALSILIMTLYRPITAKWYANIGAIKMSKVELADWPTGEWADGGSLSAFDQAEQDFERAISHQADNPTANYRLGMLSMMGHEYQRAVGYLETAFDSAPEHPGIKKSLGYAYTWSGEFDKALPLLNQIPEAKNEIQTYVWWWQEQGRDDLADNASYMVEKVEFKEQE